MLKETETDETRLFVTFLSLVAFQLGGPGPPAPLPLLATPMIVILMLFVILRFCVVFCLFTFVCMSMRH